MDTETATPESETVLGYQVVDHVLDKGGVTEDQVRAWEAKYGPVWNVRVRFPDSASALARFPDAPVPAPDELAIYRYHVECWLRPSLIEDAYRILDLDGDRRAKDEFALNLLWLGGSSLLENRDDPRKVDDALRLAMLVNIVPQVTNVPFARLKKSSSLPPKTRTNTPSGAAN